MKIVDPQGRLYLLGPAVMVGAAGQSPLYTGTLHGTDAILTGDASVAGNFDLTGIFRDPSVEHRTGTVATTDATLTSILELTGERGNAYSILAQFAGDQAGSTACAAFLRAACFRVDTDGTVAQTGSTIDIATMKPNSNWDVDIDDGGDLSMRFRVKGPASTTVQWRVGVRLVRIPGGT